MGDMFVLSPRAASTLAKLESFVMDVVIPAEKVFYEQHSKLPSRWMNPPILEDLKAQAKSLGLWNLFLSKAYPEGPGALV